MGEIYRAAQVTGVRRLDERRPSTKEQAATAGPQDRQDRKGMPGNQPPPRQQVMSDAETDGRTPARPAKRPAKAGRESEQARQAPDSSLELELSRLTDLQDIQHRRIQQLEEEKEQLLADLRTLSNDLQTANAQTQAQQEQELSAGYAAGLRQARDEIEQEKASLLEDVSQLRKLFSSSLDDRLSKVDEFAIEIAFAALTRIVGENFGDGDFARAIVVTAVATVRGAKKVRVHVAQQDLDLIRRLEGEILSCGQISEIEFFPDPRVTVGGCLIETDTGVWDARLETQLQRLRDAIDASIRTRD